MATEYRQFIVDDLIDKKLVQQTAQDVRENIQASLNADYDPSNDDTPITIIQSRGTDATGREGLWIIGKAYADPKIYPQPASREDYEIVGAKPTVSLSHTPTDFDEDEEAYVNHMANKWGA